MRCHACNRTMRQAAGWLGNLPIGPVCLARIKSIKPKRRKAAKAERREESQLDLFAPPDSAQEKPSVD